MTDALTPLTDAAELDMADFADWGTGPSGYVRVSFARTLERDLFNSRRLVKSICEEWHEDCEPCCDSYGHDENCRAVSIAAAKRALNAKVATLERENAQLRLKLRAQTEAKDAAIQLWNDCGEENVNLLAEAERDHQTIAQLTSYLDRTTVECANLRAVLARILDVLDEIERTKDLDAMDEVERHHALQTLDDAIEAARKINESAAQGAAIAKLAAYARTVIAQESAASSANTSGDRPLPGEPQQPIDPEVPLANAADLAAQAREGMMKLTSEQRDWLAADIGTSPTFLLPNEIKHFLSGLAFAQRWRPMSECPKDGTPVVLIGTLPNDTKQRACVSWFAQRMEDSPAYAPGWFFVAPGYANLFEPTHWLPLPSEPQP